MMNPERAKNLVSIPGIRHGFYTRVGGVSDGIYAGLNCGRGSDDHGDAVVENRARVIHHLGATSPDIATPYQVHGSDAVALTSVPERGALPKADAVVTATPGLAIGIVTADCGPVLFADPKAKVVGAAHAGWRGAVTGVLEQTVLAMEALGADRHNIHAALGPCIQQAAYEVGPEFRAQFLDRDPENDQFFAVPTPGARPRFDLRGFIDQELYRCGLATVEASNSCTFASESLFFSYRRSQQHGEPDYGRQISAIVVA